MGGDRARSEEERERRRRREGEVIRGFNNSDEHMFLCSDGPCRNPEAQLFPAPPPSPGQRDEDKV